MNYYERYLGGYAKKTGHLELAGHGAYTLMLDAYYSTEKPLPADYASLYRICSAISKPEQSAVRKVADEFFPVGLDHLRHNERADAEIAKAQKRIATARANGTKAAGPPGGPPEPGPGGIPAGPPSGPHMVKPSDPNKGTALSPKAGREQTRRKPKVALPEGFSVSERVAKWAHSKRYDRLGEHLEAFTRKARAKDYRYADWDEGFMGAIEDDWAGLRKPKNGNGQRDDRAKVNDDIWGRDRDDDDAIDGTAQRIA